MGVLALTVRSQPLHIDHAGYDSEFPMDGTTVVINRRELEFSVSGLMGEQYPVP